MRYGYGLGLNRSAQLIAAAPGMRSASAIYSGSGLVVVSANLAAVSQPATCTVDADVGGAALAAAAQAASWSGAGALVVQAGLAAAAASAAFAGTGTAGTVSILDLLTAAPSVNIQYLFSGDHGFTADATTTTWADQSANARSVTALNAIAPVQTAYPALTSSRNALLFNGSTHHMESTAFNAAANWWYLFVFMPVAWATGGTMMDAQGAASRHRVCQNPTAAPNWRIQGSTANGATNAGGANGSWYRARAHFTGSSADYLRIASTNATGVNTGSTPNVGRRFGCAGGAPGSFWNGALALAAAWDNPPSSGELAAIDSILTGYYGSAVGVG